MVKNIVMIQMDINYKNRNVHENNSDIVSSSGNTRSKVDVFFPFEDIIANKIKDILPNDMITPIICHNIVIDSPSIFTFKITHINFILMINNIKIKDMYNILGVIKIIII